MSYLRLFCVFLHIAVSNTLLCCVYFLWRLLNDWFLFQSVFSFCLCCSIFINQLYQCLFWILFIHNKHIILISYEPNFQFIPSLRKARRRYQRVIISQNGRIDNTMAKRKRTKRQTMICKTLHRKLNPAYITWYVLFCSAIVLLRSNRKHTNINI